MTENRILNDIRRLYVWWIRELSRTLTARRSGPRGWSMLLLNTPEGLAVLGRGVALSEPVLRLAPNAPPEEIAAFRKQALERISKGGKEVLLRLSSNDVVERTIQIPAAASDVIEQVVLNQMERIVPWPVDESRYGYQTGGANAETPDQLDIHVVATTRNIADSAVERANALGLSPYAVDFSPDPMSPSGIQVLSLEVDRLKRTADVLHFALLLLLAASVAIGSVGLYGVFDHMAQTVELEAEIAEAKARAAQLRQFNDENTRLREQREYLVKRKSGEPAAALLIEAMSRALPDNAYLTELEIHGRETHIVGKAADPTGLITKLEDSAHFEDVHFSAPTTRREGEPLGTFSIVGRAQGGAELEEGP